MSARLSRAPIGPGATPPPKARIGTCSRVWSLPRQVGSLPWSAVRTQKSSGAHRRLDLRQPRVERLEAGGEAGDVAAVAVFAVEVDQIDEDEAAVGGLAERRSARSTLPALSRPLISRPVKRWAKMSPILPIDTTSRPASTARCKQIVGQRRNREILAVGGAGEIGGGAADERPGDDAADRQRIAQAPRDAAEVVEPLEPERLLMRGDLEHRVGRGVADRLAAPHVRLAELGDDRGARGVAVAENARQLRLGDQRRGQRGGKGRNRQAGNSPSRTRPACRRSPNGRTACPCRSRSRSRSPIGRAASSS